MKSEETVFHRIREACAWVAQEAHWVKVDPDALAALAKHLLSHASQASVSDPAHQRLSDPAAALPFVVCMDAINFGSGWFPELKKNQGLSGYLTLSGFLREHFESGASMEAGELCQFTQEDCARIFKQDLEKPPVAELMNLFAMALRDLGNFIEDRYSGSFYSMIDSAGQSAAALVECLAEMPLYRDSAHYRGEEIPFYKRAQITCADLSQAFEGQGPGRFKDLDQLTLFADNLVPHVLRMEGVLIYEESLVERINQGDLIPVGSEEEVEIRAVAVHAVELICEEMAGERASRVPHQVDYLLWNHGQSPTIKATPRHRTRCSFY